MDGLRLLQALAVEEVCTFLLCTFDLISTSFLPLFPSMGWQRNSGYPFLFPYAVANPNVNCAIV